MTTRQKFIGCILVLLGAFGFSAKAVLIKLAYHDSAELDAITLMVLRMGFSLPFYLIIALWSARQSAKDAHSHRVSLKDMLILAILGALGYYVASWFDFRGLQYISAGLERLILFLYPTFVVLLTVFVHRQKMTRQQCIALLLSYAGLLLVFINTIQLGEATTELYKGSALVLVSALSFACFLSASGMMIQKLGSTRFTAYSMSCACIVTCLHFVATHDLHTLILPPSVYYLSIIMALFSTVFPSFMLNAGIRRIGASSAAIVSSSGPIGTIGLAFVFLGETVSLVQWIGTGFILLGVYVIGQK